MEQVRGEFLWKSIEALALGPESEKAIAESIRAKTLEFERERENYVATAKKLLAPPPPQSASVVAAASDPEEDAGKRGRSNRDAFREDGEVAWREDRVDGDALDDEGGDGVDQQQGRQPGQRWRRRLRPDRAKAGLIMERTGAVMSSVRQAREERHMVSEEIRTLQQRKADAKVRLQAERLSNLEHGLELEVLRLERLLDRERILELLRLTDPDRSAAAGAAEVAAAVKGSEGEGRAGGGDGGEEDEVSEELIEQLEERVAEAEERVRVRASEVGVAAAGGLEERARREEHSRREEILARDEVVRLQTVLREQEERLANTVVSYLELRHAMLRTQRVASEAREDAAVARKQDEEEMRSYRRHADEQKRAMTERVNQSCEDVCRELHRQIQLREDEACMLREQRAEAEELYEARAARLEGLLEEWKAKHAALRRRFSLETEGFRRDADNIGRRFERIRAGPPGGRPAISSRSGSSARLAVERAVFPPGRRRHAVVEDAAAVTAAALGGAGGRRMGKVYR